MRPRLAALWIALFALMCLSPQWAAAQGTSTLRTCGKSVIYDTNTNGSTQLVPTATDRYAGNAIFICGYTFTTGAGGVNVGLIFGTGTNCGTGTTKITPAYVFPAVAALAAIIDSGDNFRGLSVPAGQNLCINANAGVAVQAIVYYDNSPL
jgi:hypothetical protein